MDERKCLMTFYPTDCKDNCFNCKCGGAEATKDMYISIHNVQRVCAITGGAADTDEGEYIAEIIQNNLENMVIEAQPVKHGRWIDIYEWAKMHDSTPSGMCTYYWCSKCQTEQEKKSNFCPNCGAKMEQEAENDT